MKTLVTGSSGLIGSALIESLRQADKDVVCLIRKPSDNPHEFLWNPKVGTIDLKAFKGVDCIVNLAGYPIASKRWTPQIKRNILESRTSGTRLISDTIAKLKKPPRIYISASAVGYYGNRGDEILDEESSKGTGFLSEVSQQWEQATGAVDGVRIAKIRLGVVLSMNGGALPRIAFPFRLGLGGPIGSGKQYLSWITLDDVISAIQYVIENDEISGAINLVAPTPVTNHDLSKTIGEILRRPSLLPLPAIAVKMLMGEMGAELLLASTRVLPQKLQSSRFRFQHPNLAEALESIGLGEKGGERLKR